MKKILYALLGILLTLGVLGGLFGTALHQGWKSEWTMPLADPLVERAYHWRLKSELLKRWPGQQPAAAAREAFLDAEFARYQGLPPEQRRRILVQGVDAAWRFRSGESIRAEEFPELMEFVREGGRRFQELP